ncbi:hypothetical protein IHE49_15955 [Rhodanobacter sp. 7MK24]|uniref:hypothetical protein n=1 Tax=Rhodanobacter sp. 7MK24 TaxID=2775922 RepID=UPI001785BE45|nr:hypothetical protein [Rhodanobacter sp. 7MK24]MBD8881979.1 hypothetical protein [Rhodanobacter sp. 7MK24]
MYRWFKEFWVGSEPVEFVSSYGLLESVARLKAATKRWSLFNVSEQAAVGRVSEAHVSLQRVIPMVANSFKPVFVGRFEQVQGKVLLTGRFRLSWFVRLFMAYWFGFCALSVVLSLATTVLKPTAALMPLAGVGMFALGLGMTRLFAWFSRNDPAWLSGVIRSALHAPISVEAGLASPTTSTSSTRPTFILIVTGVFCLFGVMSFVGALQSVTLNGIHAGGLLATRFPGAVRIAATVQGALLLACAYGIYRRYLFAWWSGFAVLLLGQTYSLVELLTREDLGNARMPSLLFGLVSIVIASIWGRWWYAQRVHFS